MKTWTKSLLILLISNLLGLFHCWANPNEDVRNELIELLQKEPKTRKIDLSNRGITTLPPEIANFGQLEILNLDHNELVELPRGICNLPSLKVLKVSFNHLSFLPECLRNLSNLEVLRAYHNHLRTLPRSMGELPLIDAINVSHNQVEELPDSIAESTSLRYLFLEGNPIHFISPKILSLPRLVSLGKDHQHLLMESKNN